MSDNSEAKKAIHAAITLLVQNRNKITFSQAQFKTICRADSKYALQIIEKHSVYLLKTSGECRLEIAELIYSVQWDLMGASEFLSRYNLDSEVAEFINNRLSNNPEEFSNEDLYLVLKYFQRTSLPIRDNALNILSNNVISFADRIASEPPGMSEDIESLKNSITDYGFSPELNEILNKIDDELQKPSDAFSQVATMKHIRSFFEKLHKHVGLELQRQRPKVGNGTPLNKCGQAIDYLERKKVITLKIKDLARCLYSILSDGDFGVHALKASRDYTRLCRNMVIEYAVTLFFELDRRLAEPGDM